jgi:tRNA(Ile)-lysidine synthase
MEQELFKFFQENVKVSRPVLVGVSGGPDSTCLLHMLLLWKKAKVQVVHVDHGWRKESRSECAQLERLCQEKNLTFHSIRLDPQSMKGNLEAESRDARYAFFRKVAQEVGAESIFLGHHADDVAETVFKRVLEGSRLSSLAGMHKVRQMDGVEVLRPLLGFSKKEILAWLNARKITYFSDPTNDDVQYLRGRLRNEIFPYLRKSFGKEFESSLLSIGEESEQLYYYLNRKCKEYFDSAVVSSWGTFFPKLPSDPYEMQHVLRGGGLTLSRMQLQLAVQHLLANAANKQIGENLFIDRSQAFFVHNPIPDISDSIPLHEGTYRFGEWQVTVRTSTKQELPLQNHYRDAWKGELLTYVPMGEYTLSQSTTHMRRFDKDYSRFLGDKKIPNFLVSKVPVIHMKNHIYEDFLTGCQISPAKMWLSCQLTRTE